MSPPAAAPIGTHPGQGLPRHVIAARTAVAVIFGANGLALASWFARVPAARDALQLSAGQLGLLLLTMSAGAVLALPTAGAVAHRFGAPRVVAAGVLSISAGLAVAGAAAGAWQSVIGVGIGLFALGYGAGICEVAMNIEAAAVERQMRRTVMPRFHAAWSIGTVIGAAIGAGTARAGIPVVAHLVAVALVVLAGSLVAVRHFLPEAAQTPVGETESGQRTPAPAARSGALQAWREPRTLLIGLLVLVMALTEGTANDWLAVAFVDGHEVSAAAGAAVFGLFVTAMTVGRTVGTVALDRWGRVTVLLVTMVLAIAGTALAVLSDSLPLALVGVALWGLGTSLGFPVGMSAAADDESRAPARVSVVAAIGYTAFLAGPPVVGLLGDRVGTLRALLIVPLVLLPALALVPALRPPKPNV